MIGWVPEATTVNVALLPGLTTSGARGVVNDGAVRIVRVAGELVTEPELLLTTAR